MLDLCFKDVTWLEGDTPTTGDIGIANGLITVLGAVSEPAREVVEGRGCWLFRGPATCTCTLTNLAAPTGRALTPERAPQPLAA